ncbi:MAG: hypothetical protein O2U61_07325, partial [Candidatus Bathyarchaeota archaeon]|nr:hypothetical protein [Candidatus Bathyarchaeota archaeon]
MSSDIDLLIVVKKGRIFTVRFLLTILLDLMKERRHKNKKSRKICLNHYLTDESLEVKYPSLYNAYNYLHLLPIVNRGHVFERFRKENKWMKKYILFTGLTFRPPFTLKKFSRFRAFLRSILSGTCGEFIERKLKGFQIRRRDKNYPKGVIKDRIILEDNVIELHPDSPEERTLEEYERKISQ